MNIMFILKTFEIGGLEVVTTCLANKFVEEGHNVSIFAFENAKHSIIGRLNNRVKTYTLRNMKCNKENIYAMRSVMVMDKVQIVVNQWGLPFVPLMTAKKAAKGLNIKFISVYHSTPDMNGRIQDVNDKLLHASSPLVKIILHFKKYVSKKITSYGMRWNYNHSDRYMVLSPSFVDKFRTFTGLKKSKKLIVQTNPVTIDVGDFSLNFEKKDKEIIFVGRLENVAKRVYRVIETWKQIEPSCFDWKLTIVGDGPEKENIQNLANKYKLHNVFFEGFQPPKEYYKRASILMLTSDFEGFPLVLAEAMSFGVIPVVYDSFSSVRDIIVDGIDGLIVSNVNGKFDAKRMAKSIISLMNDSQKLKDMSIAAQEKSRNFSMETVYKQWLNVFNNILK